MSRYIKIIINTVYFALIYQLLRYLRCEIHEDVIEIEYILTRPAVLFEELWESEHNSTSLEINQPEYPHYRIERLPTDLKYILKYTKSFSHFTSSIFAEGQEAFIQNDCSHINCHMSNDDSYFGDIRHFDAILFDVENSWDVHPVFRADHQYYIFTASESAANYPLCDFKSDDYYNLTWTYKLDSDIRWSYLSILDKKGETVGPKPGMEWVKDMRPVSTSVKENLNKKRKGVAWFVSDCNSRNHREKVAKRLADALKPFNISVDIYGRCGKLSCPTDSIDECLKALKDDYHFYLAFENSMSEDYVTEKILYPLQYDTVPIVFGGADYSRFLPPGSYLNALTQNASHIASEINRAMKDHNIYYEYFRWQNHYKYSSSPAVADVCRLCEQLNNPDRRTVHNFRSWWNPNYNYACDNKTVLGDIEILL